MQRSLCPCGAAASRILSAVWALMKQLPCWYCSVQASSFKQGMQLISSCWRAGWLYGTNNTEESSATLMRVFFTPLFLSWMSPLQALIAVNSSVHSAASFVRLIFLPQWILCSSTAHHYRVPFLILLQVLPQWAQLWSVVLWIPPIIPAWKYLHSVQEAGWVVNVIALTGHPPQGM